MWPFRKRPEAPVPPAFQPVDADRLILLPASPTREEVIAGFWRWVQLLSSGDYQSAVAAIRWRGKSMAPVELEKVITTFFGNDRVWVPAIPNARLVRAIEDASEVDRDTGTGWIRIQIPITDEPVRRLEDDVLLMGLATSFRVVPQDAGSALEFEIFHA